MTSTKTRVYELEDGQKASREEQNLRSLYLDVAELDFDPA